VPTSTHRLVKHSQDRQMSSKKTNKLYKNFMSHLGFE